MASKKSVKTTKNARNLDSFEHNLDKLEAILVKMEDGSSSLDDAFSMFEDGVAISKKCSKMLEDYERKIYLIKEGKACNKKSKSVSGDDSEHYLDIFPDVE